jgi:hypothetical protein
MIVRYPQVSKEHLIRLATNLIEKNFADIEMYYPRKSTFFHEFAGLFIENNTCLMFECYFASITLSNYTLEKLLKYALIYSYGGLNVVSTTEFDENYKACHKKIQEADMSQTITMCCSAGLITKADKKYLQDEIRTQIRNGFSHSDAYKIIDPKNEKKHYMGKDPKNPERPLTDLKLNPFLQSQIIASMTEKMAFPYYKNVVAICLHIQDRLLEKETMRNSASL